MRKILCCLCLAASLVLLGANCWMNFSYMWGQGQNVQEAAAFGSASVAVDLIKAALPPLIGLALARRMWVYAAIGAATFASFTAFTFTAALGFAAEVRGEGRAQRDTRNATLAAIESKIVSTREHRQSIGRQRAVVVVANEIAALQSDPRWLRSQSCASTGRGFAAFCRTLQERERELLLAKAWHESGEAIEKLTERALQLRIAGAGGQVDGQAAILGWMFGIDPQKAASFTTFLLPLVLEIGSGLGLFLSVALWDAAPSQVRTPKAPVEAAGSHVAWVGPLRQPDLAGQQQSRANGRRARRQTGEGARAPPPEGDQTGKSRSGSENT